MSRWFLKSLLAVLLGISLLSPAPFLEGFTGMAVAWADDDDDDDDDDVRPPPRRRVVSPPPRVQPSRIQPPRMQPPRPSKPPPHARMLSKPPPPPKPRPVVVVKPATQTKATFESNEVLAIDADSAVLAQAKTLGFTVSQTVSLSGLTLRVTRLLTPARMNPAQALRILQQHIPTGKFVLNHIYRINAEPCQDGRCYGAVLIGWHHSERCGSGMKLGMVDTAVNKSHPALQDRHLITRNFADDGRPSATAHGTAVAALLVGAPSSGFPGLLPQAALYTADTFIGSDPAALRTNVFLLVQGLNWLVEQQVSAVNASLSGPDNSLLQTVVQALHQRKMMIIAAAGNDGPNAPPAFPAAYPEAVAVTAVDSLLRPYRLANRGDYLTIAAPGVRIWTPGPKEGQYRDGTSFAAPYVTAVVAQLLTSQPDLNPGDLMAQLQSNARDLGAAGKDAVFGWGLVQSLKRCD